MKTIISILPAIAVSILLTACQGPDGMRVTQGTKTIGNVPAGTLYTTKEASIVHVNKSARLATIRNGSKFEAGAFLVVKDNENGEKTGVLKALPKRASGLRTADVLEGNPDINDVVFRASAAEAERLGKIYRDPEQ